MELSIPVSCVPTSLSKSKSVIASGSSPVLASWLYTPCKLAACVVFAALNLILDCPGLELAVAVHRAVNIYIRNNNPLSLGRYYLKYLTIASSSLLYIL